MFKNTKNMGMIVVAAGLGSRLAPHTNDKPKCLVCVNGKPILWYILKNISEFHWTRIVIVVGYKKDLIIEYQKTHFPSLEIDFIENTDPKNTGCLDSLMLVPQTSSIDYWCYTNSDLLLSKKAFERVLFANQENTIGLKLLKNEGISETILQKALVLNNTVKCMDLELDGNYTHEAVGPVKLSYQFFETLRYHWNNPQGNLPRENRCYSAIGARLGSFALSSILLNNNEWADINTLEDLAIAQKKILRF